jgi:hypothetical protein
MSSPTLTELARQVSRSDLKNRDVQGALYDRLQDVRGRMASEHGELCGFLDAAAILVRSLAHLDEGGTEEVREIVKRIVEIVSASSAQSSTDTADSTAQPAPDTTSAPDVGLRTLNEMALGQVLVQLGLVSTSDVGYALEYGARSQKRLGESLVELGLATDEDIAQALRLKHALGTATPPASTPAASKKRPSAVESILLGEILVHLGKIDRKALAAALDLQRTQGVRLGDALVELGWASWSDIAEGLRAQEERGGSSERGSSETVVELE